METRQEQSGPGSGLGPSQPQDLSVQLHLHGGRDAVPWGWDIPLHPSVPQDARDAEPKSMSPGTALAAGLRVSDFSPAPAEDAEPGSAGGSSYLLLRRTNSPKNHQFE